jgi:predicted RNA-binding Zn-ribbon protein involved in translation (DUF1610 family)
VGNQVVQVKLLPTLEQAAALAATLRTVNEAATWTAEVAFAHGIPREYALRQHTRAEVPVVVIDPRHTSRRCPRCGLTAKANRPNQATFACRRCGLAGPADQVAAVNIRDRARTTWAFVNTPHVADTPQPAADTSDKPPASVGGS